MNTQNFPAKIDARRERAIARLSAAPLVAKDGVTQQDRNDIANRTVMNRAIDPRDLRSKKDRSSSARLSR